MLEWKLDGSHDNDGVRNVLSLPGIENVLNEAENYALRILDRECLQDVDSLIVIGQDLKLVALETFLVLEAAYNSLELNLEDMAPAHRKLWASSNGAKPVYSHFRNLLAQDTDRSYFMNLHAQNTGVGEKNGLLLVNIALREDVTNRELIGALCATELFFRNYVNFANHGGKVEERLISDVSIQLSILNSVLAKHGGLMEDVKERSTTPHLPMDHPLPMIPEMEEDDGSTEASPAKKAA